MSLTAPRVIYGIHSLSPYSTANGLPYGILRVLKGSSFSLAGDITELRGGSNLYPWASENGQINAELSIECSEYPDFIFELFLGKAPTVNSAEVSGNVSTFTDKNGTTVVGATGFATTITVSTPADLKFGKYMFKATGAAAGNLYCSTNIDQLRGTDAADFTDNTLLVQAVTAIGTASTHVIAGYGITLTGGASAGAMSVGDTATFEVRPVSAGGSITATFGGSADVYPDFGALIYTNQRGNGEMMEIDVFKLKAVGLNLGADTKAFSSWSVKAKASYDSVRAGVFSMRHVSP